MLTNLGNIGYKPERWKMDEIGGRSVQGRGRERHRRHEGRRDAGGGRDARRWTDSGAAARSGSRRRPAAARSSARSSAVPWARRSARIAGFAAGMVRLFIKGAVEKARQKIKDLYGVDIPDKGVLQQIVDTAKQSYGGNLDMAIRTQQIRDLIQLYAMSTGQATKGMPATVHPLDLVQKGGSLYQSPGYSNGTALPGMGGLPTLDSIGGGVASGAGPVVIQLDGPATTSLLRGEAVNAIASNPRVVAGASLSAAKSNAGRRELTSLQLSPGLVTS